MRVIGFDTATDETVVGAMDGDRITFEFRSPPAAGGRPMHSADLLPAVEEAAGSLGGWPSVDRLVVGVGPGTFTGLRIGIATAQGIRLAAAVDVAAVCTLEALALSFEVPAGATRVPVLDARRGEVFLAGYSDAGVELLEPTVGPPGELFERVASTLPNPVAAGPGALRFRSDLENSGLKDKGPEAGNNSLSARALCLAGTTPRQSPNKERIEPIYLRAPDAERWIARQSGNDRSAAD